MRALVDVGEATSKCIPGLKSLFQFLLRQDGIIRDEIVNLNIILSIVAGLRDVPSAEVQAATDPQQLSAKQPVTVSSLSPAKSSYSI